MKYSGHFNRFFLLFMLLLFPAVAADAFSHADGGVYLEMAGGKRPAAIWLAVGATASDRNLTGNIALYYLATENVIDDDYYHTGIMASLRHPLAHGRVEPFLGIGAAYGYNREDEPADSDGVDNDGDGLVDEIGEEEEVISDDLAMLIPEVGVDLWLTEGQKLSLSARYFLTTEGRHFDFWLLGAAIQF